MGDVGDDDAGCCDDDDDDAAALYVYAYAKKLDGAAMRVGTAMLLV